LPELGDNPSGCLPSSLVA